MVEVVVEARIHRTEVPDRVRAAAVRFFPDAVVQVLPDGVRAVAHDLAVLRARIWELRIIDAFRRQALRGLDTDGRGLRIRLGKQGALAGKVALGPPEVLGDLEIQVRLEEGDAWPDAERLAWWLAPETKDGEIVGPKD